MQPSLFPIPFATPLFNPFFFTSFGGDLSSSDHDFDSSSSSRVLFLSLFFQGGGEGGGMDFTKVGEKFFSSVRSATSLGLILPATATSDRPEVPARAAAAAAVARALAGIPPHERFSLPSSSEALRSIYGTRPSSEVVEEVEEDFFEEDFDPVRHVIDHIPSEDNELEYLEKQATLRLAQLDRIGERLSHQVMEHHEVMVKGMHLVREVEKDLKVANVICMNGRRHLNSSRNEVSRDLIVTSNSKKKQALLDVLPILMELRHALSIQLALESHVEEGNYYKAFQVLSEYLQLLDSFSELPAVQEMSRGVEVWLGKTLQKLDSLLLGVCQEFKEEEYITVIDAYALIGDISGLAEKIQSFFTQEVLSETHSVLKNILQEDQESDTQSSRLTYSDLWLRIPEAKFRRCLLKTLGSLFKLMGSYYAIMNFQTENKIAACETSDIKKKQNDSYGSSAEVLQSEFSAKPILNSPTNMDATTKSVDITSDLFSAGESLSVSTPLNDSKDISRSTNIDLHNSVDEVRDGGSAASSCSESPWYQLRKDATTYVSQTLRRGRRNLWQLTTSRVTVLLSSAAISASSIHQFLRIYDDLNVFILAGEAFCGFDAVEIRQKLKIACETYISSFHRQNIYALKMVLEKESWSRMPPDTVQGISFGGLVGDGAHVFVSSNGKTANGKVLQSSKTPESAVVGQKTEFSQWLNSGNTFLLRLTSTSKDSSPRLSGEMSCGPDGKFNETLPNTSSSPRNGSEVENEDLLADFIDEDSQLPSRIPKSNHLRNYSSHWNDNEVTAQTGSSLCLLRSMDKYARLVQKLEVVNVELFKGICQLFEIFFLHVYETFCQPITNPSGIGGADSINYRLKTSLSRIAQDCDQWIKPQLSSSSPTSFNVTFTHMDVTPVSPVSSHGLTTSFGLKERCAGADTISLVARILHRSKVHIQSMLLQSNPSIVEDFYAHLVDCVPDLIEHIHRTTARLLLHINGYADRIANAKWEPKELGLEHNGYVDLLLGEFKHYKTRLAHGRINKEVQDLLLKYGLENVAETLVEGLSRVRRCTDEGRALMLLDLQVLINGLQHFVSINVKPTLLIVEVFIKAYYLPETEYVQWARVHPEYSKNQIIGLINLVATMKGWKRKTRLEILEKME